MSPRQTLPGVTSVSKFNRLMLITTSWSRLSETKSEMKELKKYINRDDISVTK